VWLGQRAAERPRVERRHGQRFLELVEVDVIVHVQGGEQQRVQVGQPRPHLGVGSGRVGGARLGVQAPPFPLPLHVGCRLLRRGDRQVGVAPDQVALPGGGGVRPLAVGHLRGVRSLHVPDDAHASSSLRVGPIATISGQSGSSRAVHDPSGHGVGIAHGSTVGTCSNCPSWPLP
jgi:hypothetical protein